MLTLAYIAHVVFVYKRVCDFFFGGGGAGRNMAEFKKSKTVPSCPAECGTLCVCLYSIYGKPAQRCAAATDWV